ncbi:MAG: permease [Proteobacteria bacterium]|nr:permease [Pseudomonadota bacterium]MBU1057687.1 permease [Pseudomonadota bacterium]
MKTEEKPFTFRGRYLLLTVLILYAVLFLTNSHSALLALGKSGSVLLKILPIFAVVILFTALLNYFLKPKQIAKHLGKDCGSKGWLWALAAGVISHGPMYAWYPLLEDLRSHGMKDELLAVFFASRAIKIPLLPMMIDSFGLIFTLVFSFSILVGALGQGMCMRVLQEKKGVTGHA